MSGYILEMKNITKEFPGVRALDKVGISVKKGEIHCLVGENGSGKSTLIKILSGVYPHNEFEGDIYFEGELRNFRNIHESQEAGISTIFQELALVPELTIYENIFLGHEIRKGRFIDWDETIVQAKKYLNLVGLDIDPTLKVKDLGIGMQQMVEIAKALSKNVKLLILDEPTSALNENDSENLLKIMKDLRNKGITCIFVSHKLKEVIEVADSITVLRDGKKVGYLEKGKDEINEAVLVKYMVGREIKDVYPKREKKNFGEKLFEIKGWSAYDPLLDRNVVKEANLYVRKGEIVGIAGLIGAGRTELALSIFGNVKDYKIKGTMWFEGKEVRFKTPYDAIRAGIAYVSEDRKGNGLILDFDVKTNITLANLRKIANRGFVNENEEVKVSEGFRQAFRIKTPTLEQKVLRLSGGNQQKVSLAKWLFAEPKLLILDEPTRGIDVGAKYEVYTIMNQLVERGMAIVMISSELPEVLGMSDRIYVMSGGRIVGELNNEEATQEKIMHMAVYY